MKVNPSIFKEYDVRGKYPKEINEKIAYKIAQGFVKFLKPGKGGKIIVGRDKRPSSPKLTKAFISGILDFGIDVIDIGTVATPMLYFAVPFLKAKGGAMITASHIAKKHNGIKFVRKNSEPISGLEIKQTLGVFLSTSDVKKGALRKFNIKKDYLGAVYKDFSPGKKILIPHSFDFDGDRLIIKIGKKEARGDIIGGIIGDAVAKKGDTIVYDLRCSHSIPKYFENKGITVVPSRVGHFNIKKIMREKGAVFGMELTGHYYFKEFFYCESPLYGLRILTEQMIKTKKNLEELSRPFSKYCHSGIKNVRIKNFAQIISKLKKNYKNGAQNFLDGLTVEFSNWWFNIRPSHTEPLVRLVIEAKTLKLLEQKKKELLNEIKKAKRQK